MMSSATSARSVPTMSGAAPTGERTIPGRATNAALPPAATPPDTSDAWAATRRTAESATAFLGDVVIRDRRRGHRYVFQTRPSPGPLSG